MKDLVQGEAAEVFALEEIGLVRLLLGVFTGFDRETKRTGVIAVKGHGDGGTEGVFLAEVGDHADPSDALEEHPVQSDAGGEGQDEEGSGDSGRTQG